MPMSTANVVSNVFFVTSLIVCTAEWKPDTVEWAARGANLIINITLVVQFNLCAHRIPIQLKFKQVTMRRWRWSGKVIGQRNQVFLKKKRSRIIANTTCRNLQDLTGKLVKCDPDLTTEILKSYWAFSWKASNIKTTPLLTMTLPKNYSLLQEKIVKCSPSFLINHACYTERFF